MTDERDASAPPDAGATEAAPQAGSPGWAPGLRARAVFDVVLILVGLGYLVAALQLGLGDIDQPGGGAFPAAAATLLVACLGADLVRLLLKGALRAGGGSGRVPLKIVVVLGSILLYLVGVEIVGHLITGTVVFAVLLFVLGARRWWMVLLIAVIAGLSTDYIFTALLGLDLPTGVIEFGVDEWT